MRRQSREGAAGRGGLARSESFAPPCFVNRPGAAAQCRADMQNEVIKLALDLLVREPDVEGFFGALTKAMVEARATRAACG